ncbi:MAG: proprotein convertase P-domain-containing protein [Bradymonadaceae bacterium]|nr:proprotein convertase P-domain-containing protein [Lujinxingiaceae bacterium]
MQRTFQTLLIIGLLASLSFATGCVESTPDELAGNNTTATNEDVEATLSSLDSLIQGAPKNDSLGNEGKSDTVYPKQFSDLVASQSSVKSQGSRGVCSIFSTVALMEHLYILEGSTPNPDFSEQYLQWSVKFEVNQFRNTSGSNANYNIEAINRFGIPKEGGWPYETFAWGSTQDARCTGEEDKRPTECHTNGVPPQSALDSEKFTLPRGRWVSTRTRDLKAFMHSKRQAVIVGGTFFYQAWNHRASELPTNQEYWREGYVLYPSAEDKTKSLAKRAGHSILIVGWDDELEVQSLDGQGKKVVDAQGNPVMEKGFFIFKNSWGTGSFGVNNKHGDGYGYISYKYIEEFKSAYGSDLPVIAPPIPQICGQNVSCEDPSCADAAACEVVGEETVQFSTEPFLDIPDNNARGVTSSLVVSATGTIKGLVVDVLIDHSYNGDVRIELVHPDGTKAVLRQDDGKSGKDIDESYRVERFDGKSVAGTWKLIVTDTAAIDTGSLLEWGLTITK